MAAMHRWSGVDVDIDALRNNVAHIVREVSPRRVWAVVKANGYGHGAVDAGRAALDAGAHGLAVALIDEGVELRAAGIDAPVLVLSEQPSEYLELAVNAGLEFMVYTESGVTQLDSLATSAGRIVGVHVKVNSGMNRVGVDPTAAVALINLINECRGIELRAVTTHLAVADEPAHKGTSEQLERLNEVLQQLDQPPAVHVANSATTLTRPDAWCDEVRVGIACYGIDPSTEVQLDRAVFRQCIRWWAKVSFVHEVAAGEHVSYGWRHEVKQRTRLATVPVGYADGVPRRWSSVGGEVLINGRRRPVVGVVTMDQLIVDIGLDDGTDAVDIGTEVVLIGEQGRATITVEEWADRLDTIGYEIVCQIGSRVPRRVVGSARNDS